MLDIPHVWLWLIGAAVLGIAELMTGTLMFLFFALAAVLAGLSSLLFGPVVQWTVFLLGSIGALLLAPRLAERVTGEQPIKTNVDALIGQTARVIEAIDPIEGKGMVKVGGEVWRAQADHPIPVGDLVTVEEVRGTRLIVYSEAQIERMLAEEEEEIARRLEKALDQAEVDETTKERLRE